MNEPGGQAVLATLEAGGVTAVLGITGRHNLAIWDVLGQTPPMKHSRVAGF